LFIAGFEYLPTADPNLSSPVRSRANDRSMRGTADRTADSRFVRDGVEGRLLPMSEATLPEGPFGEFTGYYAAAARPGPVMEVTAIHYRNDPILLGSPPMKPPRFHFGLPFARRRSGATLSQAASPTWLVSGSTFRN